MTAIPETPSRQTFVARKTHDLSKYCGPMQAQAMLAAHGVEEEMLALYRTPLHRLLDVSLPWDLAHLLRKRGVSARVRTWRKTRLLDSLRKSLADGRVLILMIHSRASGGLHWISLWAEHRDAGSFHVYDSHDETREGFDGNTVFTDDILMEVTRWPFTFAVEILGKH